MSMWNGNWDIKELELCYPELLLLVQTCAVSEQVDELGCYRMTGGLCSTSWNLPWLIQTFLRAFTLRNLWNVDSICNPCCETFLAFHKSSSGTRVLRMVLSKCRLFPYVPYLGSMLGQATCLVLWHCAWAFLAAASCVLGQQLLSCSYNFL